MSDFLMNLWNKSHLLETTKFQIILLDYKEITFQIWLLNRSYKLDKSKFIFQLPKKPKPLNKTPFHNKINRIHYKKLISSIKLKLNLLIQSIKIRLNKKILLRNSKCNKQIHWKHKRKLLHHLFLKKIWFPNLK